MEKPETTLAEHPFFEGLASDLLKTIASCSVEANYKAVSYTHLTLPTTPYV